MAKSFLEKLALNEHLKTTKRVTPVITEHLLRNVKADDRRDKMFHPSNLVKSFCPRTWSLYNYASGALAAHGQAIEPQSQRIFDNGHTVHHRIQGYLHDVLWGKWSRPDGRGVLGRETYVGFKPAGEGWVYGEVTIRHAPDRILGSTDGLMCIDREKWGLEIKSANTFGFTTAKDYIHRAHKFQTFLYMHALEWARQRALAEQDDFGSADLFELQELKGFVVLYEHKDTQELIEHTVPFVPSQVVDYVDSLRPAMHAALEYERSGKHPACTCGGKNALCKVFPE